MNVLKALLKAIRPKQWVKNGLLLVAIVFSERYLEVDAWLKVGFGVAMFCLLSSAGYLFNDLKDVVADRGHPSKKFRQLSHETPVGFLFGDGRHEGVQFFQSRRL